MYSNVQYSKKCTVNVQHIRPVVPRSGIAGLPTLQPMESFLERIASRQSQDRPEFQKNYILLEGGVSDCEELVGVTHRR